MSNKDYIHLNFDDERFLTKACLFVEGEAKKRCPVDTGALRRSIMYDVSGNDGQIFTNVEYAPYIEYGTGIYAESGDGRQTPWSYQSADGEWHTSVGAPPQPYLRPALLDNLEEIKKLAVEEVVKGVK